MSADNGADHQAALVAAIAGAGSVEPLRRALLDALREAESESSDPAAFRSDVRRPLTLSLVGGAGFHRVTLSDGLVFEVRADSRIEEALLLSRDARPDHVWEPQTTRLLVALSKGASDVIVGGAYIGDQVLPMAKAMATSGRAGTVHAFEPTEYAFGRLLRHIELNAMTNVAAHRMGLWDEDDTALVMEGPAALAYSGAAADGAAGDDTIQSITIDGYVGQSGLASVDLIMLDTEGGEEKALLGARGLIAQPHPAAPHLIFEVHRHYVDWTDGLPGTSVVRYLTSNGYAVYAIRDFHDNYPTAGTAIEIIPVDAVHLDGPPHGFNVLATKDPGMIERLGLRVVSNVSPKLLLDKDPALHHPLDGLA